MQLPADAPARTVPGLIEYVGGAGERPILTATSANGEERCLAAAELPEVVARAGDALGRLGIERGARFGLHLGNSAGLEALALHLGGLWIGAVPVPLSPRLSQRELGEQIAHCEAVAVLTAGAHAGRAREAAGAAPVVALDGGLDDFLAGAEPRLPARVGEGDLADIIYTSGTSGRPKGVEFSHANLVACGLELRHAVGLGEGDVLQSAVPYFTSTGAHTNPLMALVARSHYVVEPRFDQHRVLAELRRHGTTAYFGVPSMLTLMIRDLDLGALPATLRTLAFGGSASSRAAIEALATAFPGRRLINLYGQTEAGPGGTALGPEDIVRKAGSVGCRGNGPNTRFRVVGEDGEDAAIGVTGEIVLRSPAVMRGYHRDEEATATALRGGWLHTTDVGRIDEDGYLWFVDRRRDLVIRGGFNVSTSEIEAMLQDHDAVSEAAVIGAPHDVLGEDLVAFVIAAGDPTVEELREFLGSRLADYKIPRRIEFVEELPRNATGKVLKRELRELSRD